MTFYFCRREKREEREGKFHCFALTDDEKNGSDNKKFEEKEVIGVLKI